MKPGPHMKAPQLWYKTLHGLENVADKNELRAPQLKEMVLALYAHVEKLQKQLKQLDEDFQSHGHPVPAELRRY